MRVVVLIPAHNEADTVGTVIAAIPRKLEAVESVTVLLLDDGSTDDTSTVGKKAGADAVLTSKIQIGLSRVLRRGIREALTVGADIIVTLDADGQHNPRDIARIIRPIQQQQADLVLGSRFLDGRPQMGLGRRLANRLASWVTGVLSGISVTDSQTGYRAYSREAALRLWISSRYTYTQETIIQAAHRDLRVVEVPITVTERRGSSRLVKGLPSYALRAGQTILVTYLNYKPLRFFLLIGSTLTLLGLAAGLRVLIHFLTTGMVQPFLPSAILTAVLIITGFQVITVGLFAEMIKSNREITEEILYELRRTD